MFLKMVSRYLPRVSKNSEKELEPQTPPEVVTHTVHIVEPPSPKINRTRHFGELDDLNIAPLSSMTTTGRLGAMLKGGKNEGKFERSDILSMG
jgi:hypothetical protein